MEYTGTITSTLKPIVTMLTEALIKDFAPGYALVTEEQLQADVRAWLLGLEATMDNDSDRQFAKMTAHMVRKNPGWVVLLTNRVKPHLT